MALIRDGFHGNARAVSALAVLFFASVPIFGEIDLNKPITELHLRNGTILKNVSVVAFGNSTLMAKWDGGRGSIRYDQLPKDILDEALKHVPAPIVTAGISNSPGIPVVRPNRQQESSKEAPVDPLHEQIAKARENGLAHGDQVIIDAAYKGFFSWRVTVLNLSSGYQDFNWKELVGESNVHTEFEATDCIPNDSDSGTTISPGKVRRFEVGFQHTHDDDSIWLDRIYWKQ